MKQTKRSLLLSSTQIKTSIHNPIAFVQNHTEIKPGDLVRLPINTMFLKRRSDSIATVLSGTLSIANLQTEQRDVLIKQTWQPKNTMQLLWLQQLWDCFITELPACYDEDIVTKQISILPKPFHHYNNYHSFRFTLSRNKLSDNGSYWHLNDYLEP